MAYRVEFTTAAARDFRGLDASSRKRIGRKIDALSAEPRPVGVRQLTDADGRFYRLRVGDFRIIYQVDDAVVVVLVIRIGNRRDVYRR